MSRSARQAVFLSLVLSLALLHGEAGSDGSLPDSTARAAGRVEILRDLATLDRHLRSDLRPRRNRLASVSRGSWELRHRDLAQRFEDLARRVRSLAQPPGELGRKLAQLELLLADHRSASEAGIGTRADANGEAARRQEVRSLERGLVVPNDSCENALDIGFGTFTGTTAGSTNDGQASCGSSFFSPDVWFRLPPGTNHLVTIDTLGSDFDTVLSVHTGCPGSTANQIRCDDDTFGLTSAVGFRASPFEEHYYVRLSGFNGAAGDYTMTVGPGGMITGTVTSAEDSSPIEGARVLVELPTGHSVANDFTDAEGKYLIAGLNPGHYRLYTFNGLGFQDEVYDDLPCSGGICDVSAGLLVAVHAGSTTAAIDFALREGGRISGRVLNEATGEGLFDAVVQLRTPTFSHIRTVFSDASGAYSFEGLAPGSYLLVAQASGFREEIYDDVPCCDVASADLISVDFAEQVTDVDFDLMPLPVVSGRVTASDTGESIEGAGVTFRGSGPSDVTFTDVEGRYRIALDGPDEFAATARKTGFQTLLYDGIPCPGDFFVGCEPEDGTPIFFDGVNDVEGIDFVLTRLGKIAGEVRDGATGAALANVAVRVLDQDGFLVGFEITDAEGQYETGGLQAGDHFVYTQNTLGYLDEVFRNHRCDDPCDPSIGNNVRVRNERITGGVDFDLDLGGRLTGRIVQTSDGAPIDEVRVSLFDLQGELVAISLTSNSGDYEFIGLQGGQYFVATDGLGDASFSVYPYVDELFDGIECVNGPGTGCDVTEGSAIEVLEGETTSGIDFDLQRKGRLVGQVFHESTGEPVEHIGVFVLPSDHGLVRSDGTDDEGRFRITGLPPGPYKVYSDSRFGGSGLLEYVDEVYPDTTCVGGPGVGCTLDDGDEVEVPPDSEVAVQLSLKRFGRIIGEIREELTGELTSARVDVFDSSGDLVQTSNLGSSYLLRGLQPGAYFLRTRASDQQLVDLVHADQPCPGNCDPTVGDPIQIAVEDELEIDFLLPRTGSIGGKVTDADTGTGIPGISVRLWDPSGDLLEATPLSPDSTFLFENLDPGVYFVGVGQIEGYLPEMYDDVPCISCQPTKGTPIPLAVSEDLGSVNLALRALESGIAGQVTNLEGQALSDVVIDIWDPDGSLAASALTGTNGSYMVDLDPGQYFVSTRNNQGFPNQIFDGISCGSGSAFNGDCDPVSGSAVAVGLPLTPESIQQVDFVLSKSIFADGFESGDVGSWSDVVP